MKPSEYVSLALQKAHELNTQMPKVMSSLETGEGSPNTGDLLLLLAEEIANMRVAVSLIGELLDGVIEDVPDSFGHPPRQNGIT